MKAYEDMIQKQEKNFSKLHCKDNYITDSINFR